MKQYGKKTNRPTKTDINLCMQERNSTNLRTLAVGLVLIFLLSGAVAKFGVTDLYEKLAAAEADYGRVYSQSQSLSALLKDYRQVETEYRTHSPQWSEDTHVDRMLILELVEKELLAVGRVDALTVKDMQMNVTVTVPGLETFAAMKAALESCEIVESVRLDRGQKDEKTESVTLSMTVFLQPGEVRP